MFSAEKTETNRISSKFAYLKEKGEKGLITFITAGDPNLDATKEIVLALEKSGADIIELGVPYSDPVADGPVIQLASQRALSAGTNLKKIFQTVRELREKTQIPVLLMTYFNPLLRYGLEKVAADAHASGVDGFIVPDLPFEEKSIFTNELKKHNLFLIPLVAPTSGFDRIKQITEDTKGFIYCVSLTGVTGVREGVPQNLREFMGHVCEVTNAPLAVGFGVSNPEQVSVISQYCDAVIVGSALVKTISEKNNSNELIEAVSQLTKKLKQPLININQ